MLIIINIIKKLLNENHGEFSFSKLTDCFFNAKKRLRDKGGYFAWRICQFGLSKGTYLSKELILCHLKNGVKKNDNAKQTANLRKGH
jgi:hypothetical protein